MTGRISDIRHQNRWWQGGIRHVGNKRYGNRGLSEHYRRYISGREDYVLVDIYGDHGKSGRKMDGRPELGRLLADCEAGRIDLILTKSIARFSRNMRQCVETIRRLQTLGVRVFFEKEGIDTSEPRNELLFHLMATIAEEESNSISRNMITAHEMCNRSGNPRWQRKYGYRKGENGEWVLDPKPAAKVQSAFYMACAGYAGGFIIWGTGACWAMALQFIIRCGTAGSVRRG